MLAMTYSACAQFLFTLPIRVSTSLKRGLAAAITHRATLDPRMTRPRFTNEKTANKQTSNKATSRCYVLLHTYMFTQNYSVMHLLHLIQARPHSRAERILK